MLPRGGVSTVHRRIEVPPPCCPLHCLRPQSSEWCVIWTDRVLEMKPMSRTPMRERIQGCRTEDVWLSDGVGQLGWRFETWRNRGLGLPLAAICWSTPTPLSAQSSRPITAFAGHASNAPKCEEGARRAGDLGPNAAADCPSRRPLDLSLDDSRP